MSLSDSLTPDPVGDLLTSALRSAPELQTAPSVALGLADNANSTGTDPVAAAQATAQTNNQVAAAGAYQTLEKHSKPNTLHQVFGWLGGAVSTVKDDLGGAISKGLNTMQAPLREVQHQYRFLHDVEARHGPVAALLEGLGIAAGATAGAFLGGGEGAILGGEVAGGIEGRLTYGDSWDRTSSGVKYQPTYNRQTGAYSGTPGGVSPGRDVGRILGLKEGSKPFTIVSGLGDALTDISLDPVAAAGRGIGAARSAEGSPGLLGNLKGGTRIVEPGDVDRALTQYPRTVGRFFQQVADSSAGELASQRRMLPFSPIIEQLGEAKTVPEVAQVFKDNLAAAQVTGGYSAATTVADTSLPAPTMAGAALHDVSQAVQNYEGPGSRAVTSIASLKPTSFDATALKLSSTEFDPADPAAGRTFFQAARYGMTNRAAQAATDAFVNADTVGEKIQIYRDTMLKVLDSRGIAEDSEAGKHMLEQIMGGSSPGTDAHYAVDATGRDISLLPATDQNGAVAAGVLANQTGNLALPDFRAMVRAQRELSSYKSIYGAADDWLYKHFTQGFFKKMALLSGGFAQRIALAETIPYSLKEGVTGFVKNALAANTAKLGYAAADEGETGILSSVVARLGQGIERLQGGPGILNNEQAIGDLTDLIQANGGHMVPAAVDTTTHYSGEVGGAVVKAEKSMKAALSQIPPTKMMGNDYMLFGNNDLAFTDAWQRALSEVSNDPASQAAAAEYLRTMQNGGSLESARGAGARAATDYWKAQPPEVLGKYVRSFRSSVPNVDPMEDWGRVIMENVRGVTHSPEAVDRVGNVVEAGTPNVPLLRMVADGTQPKFTDLDGIDQTLKPAMVKGRALIDIPHQNIIQRISNFGFQRVLDPMINKLSREPIYANEYLTQYAPLRPLVESGLLEKSDAMQLAQVRAVQRMVPFIHNTMERSQFSDLVGNFSPFFFAQQQAFARYGRVLADNPGAFRQLQLMTSGLHDLAAQTKDQNGTSWMVYPGTGWLANESVGLLGALGIPVTGSVPLAFSGQTQSLNTVFPLSDVAPKVGPIVSIPGHVLENLFPELRPAVTGVIGSPANYGSVYDQFIPNTFIRNSIKALGSSQTRSFQSAMVSTIQALAYQQNQAVTAWEKGGSKGPKPSLMPDASDPLAQQRFIDQVKNRTRITMMFKAFLGLATPTAVTPDIGDMKIKAELQAAIQKDGFAKGIDAFLNANPDATPYTVAQSDSPSGASVLPSQAAEDFYVKNRATLDKYPYAGAWLLPQVADAHFNQQVYNEQLAQRLREKKSPDQFLKDLYIAAGNAQFYGEDLPTYKKAHDAATASGDSAEAHRLSTAFADYLTTQLGPSNPVFWDDLKSADRDHRRQLAVQQLQEMYAKGDAPAGPQTDAIAGLLADYQRYQDAITRGRQDSYADVSRAELKTRWQAFVDQTAKDQPQLAPILTKVFRPL